MISGQGGQDPRARVSVVMPSSNLTSHAHGGHYTQVGL